MPVCREVDKPDGSTQQATGASDTRSGSPTLDKPDRSTYVHRVDRVCDPPDGEIDMTITTTTLRPGLLVSLRTSLTGNVSYSKRDIDTKREDKKHVASWETERTIADVDEHERATKVRGQAAYLVRRNCVQSAFGYLCPEDKAAELDAAVIEARKLIEEFNKTAKMSRIGVYVVTGRIAPDDVEAVKAINSEVRELMDQMATGIQNLDVKAVRDAAAKANGIGQMLSVDAQARIKVAVELARESARRIVKAGEMAAQEVDTVTIRRITEARTAFLDLDEVAEVAAPEAEARAVDFEPVDVVPTQAPAVPAFELEF